MWPRLPLMRISRLVRAGENEQAKTKVLPGITGADALPQIT